jgi:hypothetical protein
MQNPLIGEHSEVMDKTAAKEFEKSECNLITKKWQTF